MKIALGNDHAGFALKQVVKEYLQAEWPDFEVQDFGSFSTEPSDYPDVAQKVADAVASGKAERGILMCGTGIGMCITANKVQGIRAAQCLEPVTARFSRAHNNANVLTMGGRTIGPEMAKAVVKVFLEEKFQGGRHERRVEKITALEKTKPRKGNPEFVSKQALDKTNSC